MAFYEKQNFNGEDSSDNTIDNDYNNSNGVSEEQEVAAAIEQKRKEDFDLCTQEVNNLKERCMLLAADFENFKKRVERDRVSWTQSAQAEILRDILPIIDDFDRAIVEHQKKNSDDQHEAWMMGFELINKALNKLLQTYGVTPIDALVNFDPEFHEALVTVESPSHESGQIVDVVQKGYMFKGSLLRAARVTVAK